jgi:hypothetical protein
MWIIYSRRRTSVPCSRNAVIGIMSLPSWMRPAPSPRGVRLFRQPNPRYPDREVEHARIDTHPLPCFLLLHLRRSGELPILRNHMSDPLDPLEPFICTSSDPQAQLAAFVLQSLARSRHGRSFTAQPKTNESETQIQSLTNSQDLGRQLRQVNEVSAYQWVAARYAFDVFGLHGSYQDRGWFDVLFSGQ